MTHPYKPAYRDPYCYCGDKKSEHQPYRDEYGFVVGEMCQEHLGCVCHKFEEAKACNPYKMKILEDFMANLNPDSEDDYKLRDAYYSLKIDYDLEKQFREEAEREVENLLDHIETSYCETCGEKVGG